MIKSPFDYGFVADSDNAAALQSALNDPNCSWLDFSDIVAGQISDTLTLSRPKRITGIKNRSSLSFMQASGPAKPAFVFAPGSEGSEVSGLKINYNWGAVTAPTTFAGILGAFSIEADCITLRDVAVEGNKASAIAGARVGGIEIRANHFRARGVKITNVAGYGVHGLTWTAPWPASMTDIVLEDVCVTNIGDGSGISLQNANGSMSRIKLIGCHVDISGEPSSSIKNGYYIGQQDPTKFTKDILVSGCTLLATPTPDNTTAGSITLANTVGGRVTNCNVFGGGIGISIAWGYDNSVTGNTIEMQGASNSTQGKIGEAIEVAGSQVIVTGNSIEGHATLASGIAIQNASPIYNVNVGPNNIQGCTNRIWQQPGHPGPFRILDP